MYILSGLGYADRKDSTFTILPTSILNDKLVIGGRALRTKGIYEVNTQKLGQVSALQRPQSSLD